MRILIEQRPSQFTPHVAVWSRDHDTARVGQVFGDLELSHCRVSDDLWNGLNIVPPMMHFDTVSTLGIVTRERERPRVSFALNAKPFAGDVWFHRQHLVASVSFLGNPLFNEDLHTLEPPTSPELNEFFGRSMHNYDAIRVEWDGTVGIVIDAADSDASLTAIPTHELFNRVFSLAGYAAAPSSRGLLTRQIMSMLGGLQGGRAFKIPGVRRLRTQTLICVVSSSSWLLWTWPCRFTQPGGITPRRASSCTACWPCRHWARSIGGLHDDVRTQPVRRAGREHPAHRDGRRAPGRPGRGRGQPYVVRIHLPVARYPRADGGPGRVGRQVYSAAMPARRVGRGPGEHGVSDRFVRRGIRGARRVRPRNPRST